MSVEKNTIEAFETKFGVPTFGIQWHPEAYNKHENKKGVVDSEKHREIINYMARAGVAYGQKRKMLEELGDVFSRV